MESKIPYSKRLRENIDRSFKTTNFVLLTFLCEANRLIHMDIFLNVTINKSGLYILKQL